MTTVSQMLATQTIPIFVAFEPDEATARQVDVYKDRVRELVGDQLYLSDPPHMTLYLAMYGDADQMIDSARKCAQQIAAPQFAVSGWHTFYGDPLTGRNTLVLDFSEADRRRLRQTQVEIVSALATNRDAVATLERFRSRWSSLSRGEQEACCRWGFPYVGDGWHPHLTIASIDPHDWHAIESTLLRETPKGVVRCRRLQVFQLVNNDPQLIESFELRAPSQNAEKRTRSTGTSSFAKNASKKGTRSRAIEEDPTSLVPGGRARPHFPPTATRVGADASGSTSAEVSALKAEITAALWNVVERHHWVQSATITGSFLTDESLASISDIDTIVIVDELNASRFAEIQHDCTQALEPLLARRRLKLHINPTLGPLKFNDDSTAVLHLMLYTVESHRQHVIKSPFTCFDWQRSNVFCKRTMASVYPVFGLQPHHFVSSRRGIVDYLNDFDRSVISYRELVCTDTGYEEVRRDAPMSVRDRYEYAYHVMRFLMQNLLKLIHRHNMPLDGDALVEAFSVVFPKCMDLHAPLYLELRRRKKARDFVLPIPRLADRLREFVGDFETQFRSEFFESATRHLLFRHAPTHLNGGAGDERAFVGQSDPDIQPVAESAYASLANAIQEADCKAVYISPLKRCRQSMELISRSVALPPPLRDTRLTEINYGRCEGFTVAEAKRTWPSLFEAWEHGDDPCFPGGECTGDVWSRINSFAAEVWARSDGNTAICTHNVVLRCLVGHGLGVPKSLWHRIQVPHLAPITIVQTRNHGWFVDLDESVEERLLADFCNGT